MSDLLAIVGWVLFVAILWHAARSEHREETPE